jgi:hypothetical protein
VASLLLLTILIFSIMFAILLVRFSLRRHVHGAAYDEQE